MSNLSTAPKTAFRQSGEHTARGFEAGPRQELLRCRADVQRSGRALERAQSLFESGDALVFCERAVAGLEPGDEVEVQMDSGQELAGSIAEVIPLDDSLLLSL